MDGVSSPHVRVLMEDCNDGTILSLDHAADSCDGHVFNDVVVNALDVDCAMCLVNQPHIISGNTTVGTTINKRHSEHGPVVRNTIEQCYIHLVTCDRGWVLHLVDVGLEWRTCTNRGIAEHA